MFISTHLCFSLHLELLGPDLHFPMRESPVMGGYQALTMAQDQTDLLLQLQTATDLGLNMKKNVKHINTLCWSHVKIIMF